jgi:hypothetical protein
MATEHSAITDPDIHEPKGVASANAGEVYVADGAGSGDWTDSLHSKKKYLTAQLADLSTASSCWVVSPVAGSITKIWSVIDAAISGVDSVVTASIGGVNVTNGTITVANSGSAAGDVDSCTPTALNTVAAGTAIKLATDGASTNTCITRFTIEITIS